MSTDEGDMLTQTVIVWMLMGLLVTVGCMPSTLNSRRSNIADQAELRGDPKSIEEVTKAFTSFEHALKQSNLDGVMALFAEGYSDRQFTKDDLRAEWEHTFSTYHDIAATHLVTRVEANAASTQTMAFVTCSGTISGVSNVTGKRILLDSWIGEVHHMVLEQGQWRILGNSLEVRNPVDTLIAGHRHQQ